MSRLSPVEQLDIAILAATERELGSLAQLLEHTEPIELSGTSFLIGHFGNLMVGLGALGFGKVNAAIGSAALLVRFAVSRVWHIGCAGAYAEGPLRIGDVLVTAAILCGDEGILTGHGTRPQSEIAIPILEKDGKKYYNAVPLDEAMLRWAREQTPAGGYRIGTEAMAGAAPCRPEKRGSLVHTGRRAFADSSLAALPGECFQLAYGPSLTVSMVSGDRETASQRFQTHGAFAENMEGSAVAQTCCRCAAPFLECRGISNIAGERGKEFWDMDAAISHCQAIVINWLEAAASATH
jgi:futalosine hydrolase